MHLWQMNRKISFLKNRWCCSQQPPAALMCSSSNSKNKIRIVVLRRKRGNDSGECTPNTAFPFEMIFRLSLRAAKWKNCVFKFSLFEVRLHFWWHDSVCCDPLIGTGRRRVTLESWKIGFCLNFRSNTIFVLRICPAGSRSRTRDESSVT